MGDEMYILTGKDLERRAERQRALFEFHELFNERKGIDERAVAIVGATFLDNILENTLINFLIDDEKEVQKLLGVDQPMGTYSSRVNTMYCLGLICKTVRDDLRTVGKIRNKFAHQLSASFDTDPVRGWCHDLKWHEFSMMMKAPAGASPLDVFKVGVNQLICYLDGLSGMGLYDRRKVCTDDVGGPTRLR
jgi:hypothetical protein